MLLKEMKKPCDRRLLPSLTCLNLFPAPVILQQFHSESQVYAFILGQRAEAPQVRELMSCCDLIRPATPHLWQVSDAQGTTSKDQQTLRSPCEQGLLPSPASQWKGEPSKSRLTRLIWLPRHNFRLPKLRQGGKICFLATPPIPGSEKHPLNPGSERNGRIYTDICMELSSLEEVKPWLWQQAGSPQTPREKCEPNSRYAGRDA